MNRASSQPLDHAACERARVARDPRFDGRFFIAVRTTGIYCRTVCPVRLPRPENVCFFPTAAAASEQGYRPCLRCRPELAPDNPYWPQHPPLVRAALSMIENGELDQASVPVLASKLGISDRHLRRMFSDHLGASPNALALTRRTLFAKRLISDSTMPMQDIAVAAGFNNVRRFNAAFQRIYRMTPSQVRRQRPAAPAGYQLRLSYRNPFDWTAMRQFLATRAIHGIEKLDGDTYSRSFAFAGQAGHIQLQHDGPRQCFALSLEHPRTEALYPAVQKARHLLDLDAAPAEITAQLGQDPLMAQALAAHPGLRVPGCWDPFELCVRAVLGQQVSVAAARTLTQRVVERCERKLPDAGGRPVLLFPDAPTLAETSLDGLGLTGQRIATLKALCDAICSGTLDLHHPDAAHVDTTLASLPGFGPWTRGYIQLRALKHPDAFPAGDIVLRKALGAPGKALSAREAEARSRSWQPWRAYAVLALWLRATEINTGKAQ